MKVTKNRNIFLILVVVIVSIILYSCIHFVESNSNNETNRVSLFSWGDGGYQIQNRDEFYATITSLGVTDLFQEVTDEYLYSTEIKSFFKDTKELGVSVYYLTGQPQWGLDPEAKDMKKQMDKIVSLNVANSEIGQFKGVLIDIEPYLLEEWNTNEKDAFNVFVISMKETYNYAKDNNLEVILCLPNWLDKVSKESLETLIKECCDEVAIMNYNRSDEIVAIEDEVRYAQDVNKPIHCIFEFQDIGQHGLTENETYRYEGIGKAINNFNKLKKYYGNATIYLSYHYLDSIIEMLQ